MPNAITGGFPEIYRAIPVERPPIFDTTAMLKPLLSLADYLSPEKRARRKAAVAEYNYKYWLYTKGNPLATKDPFFAYKVRGYEDRHAVAMKRLASSGVSETPAQRARRLRSVGKVTRSGTVTNQADIDQASAALAEEDDENSLDSLEQPTE